MVKSLSIYSVEFLQYVLTIISANTAYASHFNLLTSRYVTSQPLP